MDWLIAGGFAASTEKNFPAKPQNQDSDDDQEKDAHKRVALENGEPRPGERPEHIAQSHGQGKAVINLVREREVSHGRKVGGKVDDLGAGRCRQEIEPKQADENENQETAGARPEKAIIETNHHADQNSELAFTMGGELRRMQAAEVLSPERVNSDREQEKQDQRLEHPRMDQRNGARAQKRKHKRTQTRGKDRRPVD